MKQNQSRKGTEKYRAGVPGTFQSRDFKGVNPKTEQFAPTPAEPVRSRYKMGGGC